MVNFSVWIFILQWTAFNCRFKGADDMAAELEGGGLEDSGVADGVGAEGGV